MGFWFVVGGGGGGGGVSVGGEFFEGRGEFLGRGVGLEEKDFFVCCSSKLRFSN